MRLAGHIGALVVLLELCGCSQSPQQAAECARQTAGSWGATLSSAAERWSASEVSTRYVHTLITQARTELQQESDTARNAAGDAAAAPLRAVASHVDALGDAVTRGDRAQAVAAGHAAASAAAPERTPPVARPQ